MKLPTANRMGETARNDENRGILQIERNLQLESIRSWNLTWAQKWQLVACGKYLLGLHTLSKVEPKSRFWEDESTEEEQMSAINMHTQGLRGIQALSSHSFFGR